jgi:hypothetical protein
MKRAPTKREEYVKFRLKEWGLWLSLDSSLTAHLKYRSLLGALENRFAGCSYSAPNEDDCEKVHKAFITLKNQHENDADCVYAFYATALGVARAAKKLNITENTLYERKRAGERFISGAIS